MRTPKVRSAAGELFWMGVRGVLPLTSISYTSENVTKREGIAHQRHDPAEFGNARSRHRVSIPSGVAGTNLRKTTHYEGKNCDPLHDTLGGPINFRTGRGEPRTASALDPISARLLMFHPFEAPPSIHANLRTPAH